MDRLNGFVRLIALGAGLFMCLPSGASAQSSPGRDWSASWGFQSANDRSVGTSRANTMRQAQQEPAQSKTYVYNTNTYNNDNRSNFVDVTTSGQVTTDFQIGDEIGQNTNAVGSMNTGSTTIEVNGSNNAIDAINSADNTGCIDGSAMTTTLPGMGGGLGWSMTGSATANGGSLGLGPVHGSISSPMQDCRN